MTYTYQNAPKYTKMCNPGATRKRGLVSTETSVKTHTSGPWTTRATGVPGSVEIRDSQKRWLATTYSVDYPDHPVSPEEAEANANLIATAPELLEAAEMLLSFLRVRYPDEPLFSNDDPNLTAFVVMDVEKAIRKAKGEL